MKLKVALAFFLFLLGLIAWQEMRVRHAQAEAGAARRADFACAIRRTSVRTG
jgi:hypothetical protein